MLIAENSKVEVIGIQDIYPVVKAQESGGVLRPSRIGDVQQVVFKSPVRSSFFAFQKRQPNWTGFF